MNEAMGGALVAQPLAWVSFCVSRLIDEAYENVGTNRWLEWPAWKPY